MWRVLIVLPVLLSAAVHVQAIEPWTAPQGDINNDGDVGVSDLQCQVLLYNRLTEVGEPAEDMCNTDDECQALFGVENYCRPGFSSFALCLPACIAPQVTVGKSGGIDCLGNDDGVDSADCLGKVQKRNADLNCDGQLDSTDLNFLVAIIMDWVGGPGTSDLDSDGRLNFCDDDSDGDGDPDVTDCAVLDSSQGGTLPELCDLIDNDCSGQVDDGLGTTTCGLGQCQHTINNCVGGQGQQCDPMQGATGESCDGVDNNCNGQVDDGFPDFDQDGTNDCLDGDDDNDGDPDGADCSPLDPNIGHGQSEVCFNNVDDDCNPETPDACVLQSCRTLKNANPGLSSGLYTVNPGAGPMEVFCDMSTDGGGWTLVYRGTNTAGTNESPVVSNGNSIGQTPIQPDTFGHHKLSDGVINQLRSGAVNNDIRFEVYVEDALLGRSYHNKACVLQSGTNLGGSDICNHSTTGGPNATGLLSSGHVGSLTRWYNDSNYGYIWGGIGTHIGPMAGGSSIGGLKPHTYCTWYDSRVCPKDSAIMIWVY